MRTERLAMWQLVNLMIYRRWVSLDDYDYVNTYSHCLLIEQDNGVTEVYAVTEAGHKLIGVFE